MTQEYNKYIFDSAIFGRFAIIEEFYHFQTEPILFTAKNAYGVLFLCQCSKLSEKYNIATVTPQQIQQLKDNKVTIRELFENADVLFTLINKGGDEFTETTKVDWRFLPEKGAYLDLALRDLPDDTIIPTPN